MEDKEDLEKEVREGGKAASAAGEGGPVAAGGQAGGSPDTQERASEPGEKPSSSAEKGGMSEEEFQRLVEESLEKVTVTDMVLVMMNQLASVGYLKLGLPEQVNLKYRDLGQAILAIDALEAMIKGLEGKLPEERLRPFRGTLANLQLNYVQQRKGSA